MNVNYLNEYSVLQNIFLNNHNKTKNRKKQKMFMKFNECFV